MAVHGVVDDSDLGSHCERFGGIKKQKRRNQLLVSIDRRGEAATLIYGDVRTSRSIPCRANETEGSNPPIATAFVVWV